MSRFGNALGDGLTGFITPADGAHAGCHSKASYTLNTSQTFVYSQQPGPAVVSSPTSCASFDALPNPDDFMNLPVFSPNEELDQFTFIGHHGDQSLLTTDQTQKRRGVSPSSKMETLRDAKRKKRKPGGFPCQLPTCPKVFDLECQATKHYSGTHMKGRKFCPICGKSFHWNKDVRRHQKQVHHYQEDNARPAESHGTQSVVVNNGGHEQHIKPEPMSVKTESKPRRRTLSTVVTMMKALNLLSTKPKPEDEDKDDDHHFFYITQDRNNWHKVFLHEVQTQEQLRQNIIKAFSPPPGNFILNHFKSGKPGKRIRVHDLMGVASEAIDTNRTLEIILTQIPANIQ